MASGNLDYDWVVIGSGFGGSVAALRLAERGYSVCVTECGNRYATEDLPKTAWNVRKYFWMPRLGFRGILRLTTFKNVSIVSGAGVGGGSLVYGETLYRGTDRFRDEVSKAIGEPTDLNPFYDVAERMLGVADTPRQSSRDRMVLATAEDLQYDLTRSIRPGWACNRNPTIIPELNEFLAAMAKKYNGIPQLWAAPIPPRASSIQVIASSATRTCW